MDVLTSEARAHRTVLMTARELDGTVETREVEPYSLRPGRRGVLLHYWCLAKNGQRSAHVANVLDARPTGHSFVPRWTVEL